MGNYRPIRTKCWEAFLTNLDCKFQGYTRGSHHKWNRKGLKRPIIFRGAKKEIPFVHIQTCLKTLGIDKHEFLNWVKENC